MRTLHRPKDSGNTAGAEAPTGRTETRLAALTLVLAARGWKPGELAGWEPTETQRVLRNLCDLGLRSKSLALAAVAIELLACNQPATVRQVMYLVVSAGWLPDTGAKSYDQIQRLLVQLRRLGMVPYRWIVDNIRATRKPSSWTGLADFAETVRDAYRKDFWPSMPVAVEVIVEKDSIVGALSEVTEAYDVPLHALRGFSSESFAWEIARSWEGIKKPIKVLFIGDHDPAGLDLERDIQEKIRRFTAGQKLRIEWRRLAVVEDDFEDFKITPLRTKKGDSRAKKFVEMWGDRCAEVEAIPAEALRQRLRRAIEAEIPKGRWDKLQKIEAEEQASFKKFLGRFVEGAR